MLTQSGASQLSLRPRSIFLAPLGLIVVALLFTLASCGTSTTTGGGATKGNGTPTGTQSGTGTSVRPCPGPLGNAGDVGSPALTLTNTSANQSGDVHVGGIVQIQLSAKQRWTFNDQPGNLTDLQPAGIDDQQLNVCVWNFRASSPGTTVLHFAGMPLCDPSVPCPQFVVDQRFTVTVA